MSRLPSGKKCAVIGCDSLARCKDLCDMHYARFSRNGHTGTVRKERQPCKIDGCEFLAAAHGLCRTHLSRQVRHGTTDELARPQQLSCTVEGCDKPHVAQGLCRTHYQRFKRHGHVIQTRSADWGAREKHPLYRCWNAQIRYKAKDTCQDWHDFWKFVEGVGERPTPKHTLQRLDDTKQFGPDNAYWREPKRSGNTEQKKMQAREYMRAWRANNMDSAINNEYKKRYGITLEDYNRMYEEQNGACDICKQPETRVDHRTKKVSRLAVDHNHTTGKVRSLLCHNCNVSLGGFKDDQNLLWKAIEYLMKHESPNPIPQKQSLFCDQPPLTGRVEV